MTGPGEVILDEAGAAPLAPPAVRYVTCLGDSDRRGCTATIPQTRQLNGTWRPYWCAACDAAYAAREARKAA